jgi:hypothetical protein
MSYTGASNQRIPSRQLPSQAAMSRRTTGTAAGSSDIKLTFSAYEFFIFNLLHGAIWNSYKPEIVKTFHHIAVSFGLI